MSVGDEVHKRRVVRLLQGCLLAVAGYGLVTFQVSLVVNGSIAFLVTLAPALLRREFGYVMDVGLVLWVTVAVFLHAVGALGPYSEWPLYDELAHAVSAGLVAGVGYATLRALEEHSAAIRIPTTVRSVFVVVVVLATGVAWELLEFVAGLIASTAGMDSLLVVYGVDDIVTDFVFNGLGAVVLAAVVDERSLSGLVRFIRDRFVASDRG